MNFAWPGFLAEFHLTGRPKSVQLFGKAFEVPEAERYGSVEPHYRELYETEQVAAPRGDLLRRPAGADRSGDR